MTVGPGAPANAENTVTAMKMSYSGGPTGQRSDSLVPQISLASCSSIERLVRAAHLMEPLRYFLGRAPTCEPPGANEARATSRPKDHQRPTGNNFRANGSYFSTLPTSYWESLLPSIRERWPQRKIRIIVFSVPLLFRDRHADSDRLNN